MKRDILRLTDLSKAAYLLVKGNRHVDTEVLNGRCYFVFDGNERCKAHLLLIPANEPVGIDELLRAVTQLKAAMHEARESNVG